MKNHNKLAAIVFNITIFFVTNLFAQNILTMTIGIGDPASTATVTVFLANGDEVEGVQFDLHAVPDVLEITNAVAVGRSVAFNNVHVNELPNNDSRVLLFDTQGGTISPGNGEILQLTFNVLASANNDTSALEIQNIYLSSPDGGQLSHDAVNTIFIISPIAEANGPYAGTPNNPVNFDASASFDDPAGNIATYEWDWDNNGSYDLSAEVPTVTHSFVTSNTFVVGLRVTDNDGLMDEDRCFVVIGPGNVISGRVAYFNTPLPVRQTTLTLSEDKIEVQSTDDLGMYSFVNLSAGENYTVTPAKIGDVADGTVIAYDASLALQAAIGILTLNGYQATAADADGSGSIVAQDAGHIARYAVGLPPVAGSKVGTWAFEPVERSYHPWNGDQVDQDYAAVLIGDVDGNWLPQTVMAKPNTPVPLNPEVILENDDIFVVLFLNQTSEPVCSSDLEFRFDPVAVEFLGVGTTDFSKEFSVVVNDSKPGYVRIAAFSSKETERQGALLTAKFRLVKAATNEAEISIDTFRLNKDQVFSGKVHLFATAGAVTIPKTFQLEQNSPNPMRDQATFSFYLPQASYAELVIYDITGKQLCTLIQSRQAAGSHQTVWDGRNDAGKSLPSGLYFFTLRVGEMKFTKKLLLLK